MDETTEMSRRTESTAARKRLRQLVVVGSDLLIWPIALSLAYTFYGQGPIDPPSIPLIAVAIVAQFTIGMATGLYRGRFRTFSFDEAGAVAITAGATGAIVIAVEYVTENAGRAGQIIVLATSVAVCLQFGHRYLRRIRAERVEAAARSHLTPLIVYGAGEGGDRAIAAMQTVRSSTYRPVALVDDDPAYRQRRIGGLRVEGGSDDLARIAVHRRHDGNHFARLDNLDHSVADHHDGQRRQADEFDCGRHLHHSVGRHVNLGNQAGRCSLAAAGCALASGADPPSALAGPRGLAFDPAFSQRTQELMLYVRQHHGAQDLADLGRHVHC